MTPNDGGPAFPSSGPADAVVCWGMSLRDYFAGQALIGLISCPDITLGHAGDYASRAYEYADAMLKARGIT